MFKFLIVLIFNTRSMPFLFNHFLWRDSSYFQCYAVKMDAVRRAMSCLAVSSPVASMQELLSEMH